MKPTPKRPNPQTWHAGPPPSIGWWPASTRKDPEATRWWNGEAWSVAAFPHFTAQQAEEMAAGVGKFQQLIRWRHRPASWPARSLT